MPEIAMPKWNTVRKGDGPGAGGDADQKQQALEFKPDSRVPKIEVVVRHWMHGTEMRVVLPKHAKFRHIKKAIAKCLGREDDLGPRLKLMYNQDGIYSTFKDGQAIGDRRLVLARCADELLPEAAEAVLSEGEVSVEEEEPTNAIEPVTRSKILPEMAANSAAARRVRAGGPLTKKHGISLQLELLEAFKENAFQQKLIDLEARREAGMSNLDFSRQRSKLMLSVQKRVLPKYGFEGTSEGVERMLASLKPFFSDPECVRNLKEINDILGLSESVERWSTVSSQCRMLRDEPRRGRARAMPPMPGLPIGFSSIVASSQGGFSMPSVQSFADSDINPGQGLGVATVDAKYEPWPPGQGKPFNLYVIGSWNDNIPMPMHWECGIFTCSITMGSDGMEIFQLLQGKDWSKTYYPSVQDATPLEEHSVLGPDDGSKGRSWLIGSADGSVGKPGDNFDIIAAVDSEARVVHVDWHLAF